MAGYLGDKLNMVAHHLAMMKPECKIYYVNKADMVYFVPDTLEQSMREKFVTCKYCSG